MDRPRHDIGHGFDVNEAIACARASRAIERTEQAIAAFHRGEVTMLAVVMELSSAGREVDRTVGRLWNWFDLRCDDQPPAA